jgi:hypothetical protein
VFGLLLPEGGSEVRIATPNSIVKVNEFDGLSPILWTTRTVARIYPLQEGLLTC